MGNENGTFFAKGGGKRIANECFCWCVLAYPKTLWGAHERVLDVHRRGRYPRLSERRVGGVMNLR